MNEQEFKQWRRELLAKGWTEDAQGNLSKRNPLGGLDIVEPQPEPVHALGQAKPVVRQRRARSLVIVITLISFRKRILDPGHIEVSFKGLQDAVAKSLGVDDGDRRLIWEYRQIETAGDKGTLVHISLK